MILYKTHGVSVMQENRGHGLRPDRSRISIMNIDGSDANTIKQREEDTQLSNFIHVKRWIKETQTVLDRCETKKMSLIETQRYLLQERYAQIPELQFFLRFDKQTGQHKSFGEFNCHLDGNALCHMNCVVSPKSREDSDESIAVTVTWNRGMKNSRVENWILNIFTYKLRSMRDKNKENDKKPLSLIFVSHDIHDAFSTSAAQCRDVTLVSMRACLDALTA
jgi:hypothetical protein